MKKMMLLALVGVFTLSATAGNPRKKDCCKKENTACCDTVCGKTSKAHKDCTPCKPCNPCKDGKKPCKSHAHKHRHHAPCK